ncbi:MAG: site-specific integrase [Gammaproteobacteria bacterium]|nr:site-specific integrase [Gammaproteobacteria bacterium]
MKKRYTEEEIIRRSKSTRPVPRSMVFVSYYVGLRACEIAALKVSDVLDGEGQVKDTVLLTQEMTKGRKANSVYLSEFVKKEVQDYIESNTERLVTLRQPLIYPKRIGGHFSSQTLRILFKTLYASIGMDASSHSGRRTFISALLEK